MKKHFIFIFLLLSAVFLDSCQKSSPYKNVKDIDGVAVGFVKLALVLGNYDRDFVDSYFGPEKLKQEASKEKLSVKQVSEAAKDLTASLDNLDLSSFDNQSKIRKIYLKRMLNALITKAEMLDGKKLKFDAESNALYDAVSPIYNIKIYDEALKELSDRLPGSGSLAARLDNYNKRFKVPSSKLEEVMTVAINEARKRTLAHIQLPAGEEFKMEFIKNQPWGAYNWFKGNSKSLIQINTDQAISVDRVITLVCHEGYPGHHVFMNLIEKEFYTKRHWVEYSIYPLFSPVSMLAEGMANYGIDLCFPENERIDFEKRVLCPLAGINPSGLEEYHKILKLLEKLEYAGNEAARRYLDGNMSSEHTLDWLIKYKLMPQVSAEHYLRFIERYRSYVITYNVGQNLVAGYINSFTSNGDINQKWDLYKKIIIRPSLPSDLKK